jgi:hypothetical protein
VLIDLVLVTGVNVAYVYIDHNYDSDLVHTAQVAVALFKVTWNTFVVQVLLRLTAAQSEGLADSARKAHHISLAVFVILFNNIAAPFVATAYVSSNCFYSVFVSPPLVNVAYSYTTCATSDVHGNYSSCSVFDNSEQQATSYSPPFIYSYQCSSTFVTTYSSIYIFMFSIEAFAMPLVLTLLKWLHQSAGPSGVAFGLLDWLLPKILKPVNSGEENAKSNDGKRFWNCDAFVVKLLNMVAILSTFGVILPPVAAICCVAVLSVTLHTQLLIGRVVVEARRAGANSVLTALNNQCSEAAKLFVNSVWIVVPFAALFYSLFLFETLGDSVGWRAALWAPLFMCSLPLFLRLIYTLNRRVRMANGERRFRETISTDRRSLQYTTDYGPFHINDKDSRLSLSLL